MKVLELTLNWHRGPPMGEDSKGAPNSSAWGCRSTRLPGCKSPAWWWWRVFRVWSEENVAGGGGGEVQQASAGRRCLQGKGAGGVNVMLAIRKPPAVIGKVREGAGADTEMGWADAWPCPAPPASSPPLPR